MFCGLPVKVAALPAFEAIATARRYGTGLRRKAPATSMTRGAITRQIASLTRKAEKNPVTMTIAAKSTGAEWARRRAKWAASSKKPETRNWLTIIIMPSKSVMASRSMALSASENSKTRDQSSGLRQRALCRHDRSATPARGRAPLPHMSKRRQQSWRPSPSRLKQGSIWSPCGQELMARASALRRRSRPNS